MSIRQYYSEVEEAARIRKELIVPELAKRNGVTEQLKAENQMEWVGRMNNLRSAVTETVDAEVIFV